MKNRMVLILFSLVFGLGLLSPAPAKKRKIYAGTISNKNFVVGAPNEGTGLFRMSDNGNEIENIGFKNMRTFSFEVFPKIESGLIYCANGNGFFVSKNDGKRWRVTTGWEITEVLITAAVPTDPKIVYIGTAYGLYKSTEFGENFKPIKNRYVYSFAIDQKEPTRLYLGQEDGFYISRDGGNTFDKVANFPYITNSIAQDPKIPNRLYIGTEDHGILISTDRGATWRQVPGHTAKTIYKITIDEKNPKRIFAASFQSGVLRSNDRGETWNSFTGGLENIPVYTIVIHPDRNHVLYAGTANKGILKSIDNGETWKPFALDGSHVLHVEIK